MQRKNYFVSDLHLFAQRSLAHRHKETIYSAAEQAETFIFGGDIFDFAWTTRASIEQTVDDAASWLARVGAPAPGRPFHFF